ncbi:hypothetical protein WN51_12279 [Melipona quadrifasciata]|uniref:Uncharacterized protein n=1 Tax=Melipona quadrifasciata TaxID=166423 RepID=A0A0M9A1Q8_9HYME|nr:hypothetical protein WN51_12279 [Melipona quadrifasciata]
MKNGQRYPLVKVIPQNHNKSVPFNGPDKTDETSIIGSYYLVADKPIARSEEAKEEKERNRRQVVGPNLRSSRGPESRNVAKISIVIDSTYKRPMIFLLTKDEEEEEKKEKEEEEEEEEEDKSRERNAEEEKACVPNDVCTPRHRMLEQGYVQGGKEGLSVAVTDEFYSFDLMEMRVKKKLTLNLNFFFRLYSTHHEDPTWGSSRSPVLAEKKKTLYRIEKQQKDLGVKISKGYLEPRPPRHQDPTQPMLGVTSGTKPYRTQCLEPETLSRYHPFFDDQSILASLVEIYLKTMTQVERFKMKPVDLDEIGCLCFISVFIADDEVFIRANGLVCQALLNNVSSDLRPDTGLMSTEKKLYSNFWRIVNLKVSRFEETRLKIRNHKIEMKFEQEFCIANYSSIVDHASGNVSNRRPVKWDRLRWDRALHTLRMERGAVSDEKDLECYGRTNGSVFCEAFIKKLDTLIPAMTDH